MTPAKQRVFGNGNGDCFRACMASMLELPNCDDLPNLDHPGGWLFVWIQILATFGMRLGMDDKAIWREGYWIASVPSLNLEGKSHAIVMHDCNVAFDPSTMKTYEAGKPMLGEDLVNYGWWLEISDVALLPVLETRRLELGKRSAVAP